MKRTSKNNKLLTGILAGLMTFGVASPFMANGRTMSPNTFNNEPVAIAPKAKIISGVGNVTHNSSVGIDVSPRVTGGVVINQDANNIKGYDNLNGVVAVIVPPGENKFPTLVYSSDGGSPLTADIYGYSPNKDERLLLGNKVGYFNHVDLTNLAIRGALESSIENHTFSNNVLAKSISEIVGSKCGSEYVLSHLDEISLNNESCYGEKGCSTYTAGEISLAGANFAIEEKDSEYVIEKTIGANFGFVKSNSTWKANGTDLIERIITENSNFGERDIVDRISRSPFGYALPISSVLREYRTNHTGYKVNGDFGNDSDKLIETCAKKLEIKEIFSCSYDGMTKLVNKYRGFKK